MGDLAHQLGYGLRGLTGGDGAPGDADIRKSPYEDDLKLLKTPS